MFKKFLHFIKYNNFATFLILAVFLVGSGVFAATETGQELIGQKQTNISGSDNTVLLSLDFDDFDMEFNIESIEEDAKYYYITYTFLDLVEKDNAWQFEMRETVRKISKRVDDLGDYIAEELSEQYDDRVRILKEEQEKAQGNGEETRTEVEEYDGLIGETLDVVARVFPKYRSEKVREVPSPSIPPSVLLKKKEKSEDAAENVNDSLTDVYLDYINRKDPDGDDLFGDHDNCPKVYNPEQEDEDDDGVGDACTSVESQKSNVESDNEEINNNATTTDQSEISNLQSEIDSASSTEDKQNEEENNVVDEKVEEADETQEKEKNDGDSDKEIGNLKLEIGDESDGSSDDASVQEKTTQDKEENIDDSSDDEEDSSDEVVEDDNSESSDFDSDNVDEEDDSGEEVDVEIIEIEE